MSLYENQEYFCSIFTLFPLIVSSQKLTHTICATAYPLIQGYNEKLTDGTQK